MHENINAPIPPDAAAIEVVTNTKDVAPGSAESTEPPLNPNQPSHKINTPAVAVGRLCPGIALGFPFSSNFPRRAPRSEIATSAAHPPTL